MKNKKIIGTIFIVVALVLIAIGGITLINNHDNDMDVKEKNNKGVSYGDEVTKRNYQATTKISNGATITFDKDMIKSSAKEIGFKDVVCENNYCSASNNGYPDADMYRDTLMITFDADNTLNNVTTMIYYSDKDFNYDTLYKDVNSLIGSYVGIEISKENLEKIKKPSRNEEVNENNYNDSKFTIQMSLQYIEEKELYVFRSFIIETAKYK